MAYEISFKPISKTLAAYFAKSQIAYKDMEIIAVSKDFGYCTMEQVSSYIIDLNPHRYSCLLRIFSTIGALRLMGTTSISPFVSAPTYGSETGSGNGSMSTFRFP